MYVKDHMTGNPYTITKDVVISKAVEIMRKNHFHRLPVVDDEISVLPVVDENNKVIGIITDKDIFQAFVELLGYRHQGTRFILGATDTPGEFAPMAKLFGDNNANLDSLAVYHTKDRGAEIVVKASGSIPVEDMAQILVDAGYDLRSIVQTTKFGTTKSFDIPVKRT